MTKQTLLAVPPSEATDNKKFSPHHGGEEVLSLPEPRRINSRLVSLLRPNSAEAAGYYRLRLATENLPRTDGATVLAVSSAREGEGKTLTAINLAGALAKNPANRVLLLELDIRQPNTGVAKYLGVKRWPSKGVVEYLSNDTALWNQSVYYVTKFNLYVMPVEKKSESPYELLGSPRLGELINEARHKYDYVIADTAPMTMVSDTQLIARWVDRFMIVVAADRTTEGMLDECMELMEPEKVLGLVFNACQPAGGRKSAYL